MEKKIVGSLVRGGARVLCSILLFSLAGCSTPGIYLNEHNIKSPIYLNDQWVHPHISPITPQLLAKQSMKVTPYRVGSHDVLNIIVWGHPEISTLMDSTKQPDVSQITAKTVASQGVQPGILVNTQGKIFFPYAGVVRVRGKTVDQIRRVLAKRLKTYIVNPQVSVRVSAFRSQKINIIGQILHEQTIPITDTKMTLMDAINIAGGINPKSADPRHIYVFRGSLENPKIFWLNAKSPQNLLSATNFSLKANDIVYISAVGVARWNRVVSQIMPTIQTLWYTKAMTDW